MKVSVASLRKAFDNFCRALIMLNYIAVVSRIANPVRIGKNTKNSPSEAPQPTVYCIVLFCVVRFDVVTLWHCALCTVHIMHTR